jgi:hypothetical protein
MLRFYLFLGHAMDKSDGARRQKARVLSTCELFLSFVETLRCGRIDEIIAGSSLQVKENVMSLDRSDAAVYPPNYQQRFIERLTGSVAWVDRG